MYGYCKGQQQRLLRKARASDPPLNIATISHLQWVELNLSLCVP